MSGIKGLCSNYREVGVGKNKREGGLRGNYDEREGDLDVKLYTFGGRHYFFIPFHKLKKGLKSY